MYGQGSGVVASATTTAAGVVLLPNTGGHSLLTYVGIAAIVLGVAATVVQLAVMGYRKYALKNI